MNSGSDLLNNSSKGLISGAALVGFDTYMEQDAKLISKTNLKTFGYQAVSSLAVNQIKSLLRPIIPSVVDGITDAYINPLIVAGTYTILARVVDGSKDYMYNFMFSMSAEMIACGLDAPVKSLMSSSGLVSSGVQPNKNRILG